MAAGKPVVSTNAGGIAELVQQQMTGFLGNTAEELAAYIQLLLEQPMLAVQMGQNAAALAEARFSHQREFVELSALYKQLLTTQKVF